jgi:hypothetical protein
MVHRPLERLWNTAPWAVDFMDGAGDDLVIAFSSIGHDPTRPPSPEFVATASANGTRRAVFVTDASRSWANDPGLEQALFCTLETVSQRRPVARLATIGLSMGAFSALVAAQILPVDVVLAFGPQWSVAPGIVPGEMRWSHWTDRLPKTRWPNAPLPTRSHTYLFHGALDDLPQALPFPRQASTDHLLFAGLGHSDLVPHLKSRGALGGLLEAALAGDRRRLLRITASAGGRLRHRLPYG